MFQVGVPWNISRQTPDFRYGIGGFSFSGYYFRYVLQKVAAQT